MKIFQKKNKLIFILFIAFVVSVVSGAFSEYFYTSDITNKVNIAEFNQVLTQKQQKAINTLARLKNAVIHGGVDSLYSFRFNSKDLSYYLLDNSGELIYWSANYTNFQLPENNKPWQWAYISTSNAHGIFCTAKTDYGTLVALIRIRNNYVFENDQLKNYFASGFDINNNYDIVTGSESDELAIVDKSGSYLFSLREPDNVSNNTQFAYAGFVSFGLALIFLLLLYVQYFASAGRSKVSFKSFFSITLCLFCFLVLVLYFKIPTLLFFDKLTSSFDYSAGFLLASIIHLSVITAFVIAVAYVFYHYLQLPYLKSNTRQLLLLLVPGLFYLLMFYVLKGLIIHSGIAIPILNIRELSFASVWLHVLIFLWGIAFALLFFKVHINVLKYSSLKKLIILNFVVVSIVSLISFLVQNEDVLRIIVFFIILYIGFSLSFFVLKKKSVYLNAFVWVFCFSLFFIESSVVLTRKKVENKYRILAENFQLNGSSENDRVTEIMLEELDDQLNSDAFIVGNISNPDSISLLTAYLNENYFRGYWNKYDVQINAAYEGNVLFEQYKALIDIDAIPVRNTQFYSFSASLNDMAYLGMYKFVVADNKEVYLFVRMYPRKNFKSYSFPKFLIHSEADIQSRLNISIARYKNDELISKSNNFEFPQKRSYFPFKNKKFYKAIVGGNLFYIYQHDKDNSVIIADLSNYKRLNYIIYAVYTFFACLVFVYIVIWFSSRKRRRTRPRLSFSTRYQMAFVFLLLSSFIGIFYVSVSYITAGYKEEQLSSIDKKKTYIQNALQEKYYWTQDLSQVSTQGLNLELQELSYMYKTDINVYDNFGHLVGSSQPLIYNKNLMGRQIAPEPFFYGNSNINQEEYIGDLRFLTAYTDFLNGDFMQIGFISIPLYVSAEEVRAEIENFLGVVIHIYLIIVLLSVMLSFFIGRQLSAPLKLIESKLKLMRFGQRNEKIDYQVKDEIGQLVVQYNKTIDELEKSARLLAQTERESAWRTMARQIAHEINNPLTPMKLTIQQLQRTKSLNDDRFDDYFEKSTKTLVEQIDNLSRIAGSFSNFAKLPEARFELFDIAARLNSTTQLFIGGNERCTIDYAGPVSGVNVFADPEQMLQVFNNLLKNAVQAIPADKEGLIKVELKVQNETVFINFTDNGKGISEDLRDKIFMPSFTTKSYGMGLGLAITKNIIEMAGGKISYQSVEGEYTTFTIELKQEV